MDPADAMRERLLRKVLTLQGRARICREPACRRARRCAGKSLRCLRDAKPAAVSPEEAAQRLAFVYRAVRRRVAET